MNKYKVKDIPACHMQVAKSRTKDKQPREKNPYRKGNNDDDEWFCFIGNNRNQHKMQCFKMLKEE